MTFKKQEKLTPPTKGKVIVAATRMYTRTPEWKTYTSIAFAKSGFSVGRYERDASGNWLHFARSGELWILRDGEWVLDFYTDENKPVFVKDLPWRDK